MNRLTEKKEHGEWSLKGVDWQQLYVGRTITQEVKEKLLAALFKLLHYENSGLRPDEVMALPSGVRAFLFASTEVWVEENIKKNEKR